MNPIHALSLNQAISVGQKPGADFMSLTDGCAQQLVHNYDYVDTLLAQSSAYSTYPWVLPVHVNCVRQLRIRSSPFEHCSIS